MEVMDEMGNLSKHGLTALSKWGVNVRPGALLTGLFAFFICKLQCHFPRKTLLQHLTSKKFCMRLNGI